MAINRIPLYVLNNYLKFEKKIYQVFGLKLGRPLRMKAVLYGIVFGVGTIVFYNLPYLGNLINWMPKGVLVLLPVGLAWLLADVGTENRSPIFFFRSFIGYQVRNLVMKKTYYRGKEIPRETVYQFRNYFTYTVSDGGVNMLEEMASALSQTIEKDPTEPSREEMIGIQVEPQPTKEVEVHPEEAPAKVNDVILQEKTSDAQEEWPARRTDSLVCCEEYELPVQVPLHGELKLSDAARMPETVNNEATEKESQRLAELEQKVISLQKQMEGNMQERAKGQESVNKATLTSFKPPFFYPTRWKREKKKDQVKKEVFELLSLNPIKSETSSEEKS